MPGAGTRTAITTVKPASRLLDLTRLISRVGRGPLTGVDRVEMVYLTRLLAETEPFFALIRTALGFVLLDAMGARAIHGRLCEAQNWGRRDLLSRLTHRRNHARGRAESDLRRLALARCRKGGLATMLARHVPVGTTYLNVGHSNLSEQVFQAIKQHAGMRTAMLIHDTIPLDHPEFQRPGTPEVFERRLRAVGQHADLVIYNSAQSQRDAERYFKAWGRVPDSIVAHLGVDLPMPDPAKLPQGYDLTQRYFVTVGTIEPRKNHALLLDIWEGFLQNGRTNAPQLFIIGSRGWANDTVFARLDSSPVMGRLVHEIAGLDDAGMAALIKGAVACLFPSVVEGFGLPPVEAAALGVPVVCTDLPIYGEILGNIPVYAAVNDRYSWTTIINRLMDEQGAGTRTDNTGNLPTLPNWSDHFNLVLKVT